MKKLIAFAILSLLLNSCGNPLGDGYVDQEHRPGVQSGNQTNAPLGFEFNPLSHSYIDSSGGRFKVAAVISTHEKPATLTQSGRFKVYSSVQGQFFSDESGL